MGPEKKLEIKFTQWVKTKGGLCIKLESPSRNGVSDRLVVLPLLDMFVVEFKTMQGVVSAEQKKWFRDVVSAGGLAVIIKGERDLDHFIKSYDELQRMSDPVNIFH